MQAFYHAGTQVMTIRTRLASRHLNREPQRERFSVLLAAVERALSLATAAALLDEPSSQGRIAGPESAALLLEAVVEHVRRTRFPHLPTRVSAIFLTPTMEDARRFEELTPGKRGYIHCCLAEPDDGAVLDWNLIVPPARWDPGTPLDRLFEIATRYWSGESSAHPIREFVTHGQVMVLQRME